jgi:hypothetical protein
MPVLVDTKEALHHVAYYVHATTESFYIQGNNWEQLERMIH